MKICVHTVNMADGREFSVDAEFGDSYELHQWADREFPGWSSLVVTVLP